MSLLSHSVVIVTLQEYFQQGGVLGIRLNLPSLQVSGKNITNFLGEICSSSTKVSEMHRPVLVEIYAFKNALIGVSMYLA